MQEEKTDDLVDRMCRVLVSNIPGPAVPQTAAFWADLQIGSFRDKTKAYKLSEDIQRKGFSSRIEKVSLKKNCWYRVLVGPYRYAEALKIKRIIAKNRQVSPVVIYRSNTVAVNHKSS